MNDFYFYEALNEIDSDLIAKANIKAMPQRKSDRKKGKWILSAVAAVFVLLICVGTADKLYTAEKPTDTKQNAPYETAADNEAVTDRKIKLFSKSVVSDEFDSYGDDGLRYVDLILNGVIYHQIDIDDYSFYGLKTEFSKKDFGEYIGEVQELTSDNAYDNKMFDVSSHEPSLNKAEAYYYAPVGCKAVVIAENGDSCALFIADDFDGDFSGNYHESRFELFGITSASDIECITCEIFKGEYDNTNTAIIETVKISAADDIKTVYDILVSDEKSGDQSISVSGNYSISMTFALKDGLTVGHDNYKVCYYPYTSGGYVANKGVLTFEQSESLKEIFNLD